MLHRELKAVVDRSPDRAAFVYKGMTCTYGKLWAASDILVSELKRAGVKRGDRVAILSDTSVESLITWWSVLRLGAINVYINEKLTQTELNHIIGDSAPYLCVCGSDKYQELLPKGLKSLNLGHISLNLDCVVTEEPARSMLVSDSASDSGGSARCVSEAQSEITDSEQNDQTDNPDNIAVIVYTSGSTGVPKGVCLTHRNLMVSALMSIRRHGIASDDRYLAIVPFHYVHGIHMMLCLLTVGGSVEIMPHFIFPTEVTKRIQSQKITCVSGVPYHFSALIDRGKFIPTELPELKWIAVTGGAISADRLNQLLEHKPDLDVHIAYGQTECAPRISQLCPSLVRRKPASVGRPDICLKVEVVTEEGFAVPQGETGELVVSGLSVMDGYWNDAEATAKVFDDRGRLRTGDLAYIDNDGDIFIRGRVQAMIKTAGERIFPEELENILLQHEAVDSAAVVGKPDELYGQVVEAHIVLKEVEAVSCDEVVRSIEAFCLEHTSYARAPKRYKIWTSFPMKANGKVDKKAIELAPNQNELKAS